MPAGGAVVSGVLGLGEAAVGLINAGKAKKEAAALKASRPKLKASPYLKDQLSLAESELSNGMSAEAKSAYEEGLDKTLSTSLGTAMRLGGSPNDVGSIFANNADGRARLAMMKDNLRLNEITNLTRAQDANEEERQKEFQFNDWAPWADASQANAQAKQTAQSEIFSGLGTAGSGLMKGLEGASAAGDFAKYSAVTTPRAATGGRAGSPAGAVGSINPNSAPSLLDQLLAS